MCEPVFTDVMFTVCTMFRLIFILRVADIHIFFVLVVITEHRKVFDQTVHNVPATRV